MMYAIRHKPSGAFFPVFKGGQRRGSTNLDLPFVGMPRLFSTKVAAQNCLRWWLKGAYEVWYGDFDGDYFPREKTTPKDDRKADEMEVLSVDLVVV